MRVFLLVSLGCVLGCGGAVAQDVFGDASTDASSDVGRTDAPSGVDAGPPSDVAPPACAAMSDPCFASFAAQAQKAAACMAHPDTCATSGGKDASGCGHQGPNPTGGSICTWPDGATLVSDSTGGSATNATHDLCYKYSVTTVSGNVYDVHVGFGAKVGGPDGDWIEELTDPGKADATTVFKCPDGSTSKAYTQAQIDACALATVCCSASTPATCK